MTFGTLEDQLAVWQFGVELNRERYDVFGFHPNIRLWAFSLKHFPPQGELLKPCCYRGLYWTANIFPLVRMYKRYSFRRSRWLRRILRYDVYVLRIPTKITTDPVPSTASAGWANRPAKG